ncbi:MAG TPA: hypothetical protein VKT81_19820 [Bryobacteraceae bacterium]|nr:hypothetical protein [Bryobacteraceae bacterium]
MALTLPEEPPRSGYPGRDLSKDEESNLLPYKSAAIIKRTLEQGGGLSNEEIELRVSQFIDKLRKP